MIGVTFTVAELDDLTGGTDITDQLDDADCRIRLNAEGIGGAILPFGESISPSPFGKAIRVDFDGTPAFSWVPEKRTDVEVDRNEEAVMVTEYSGPGLAGLLNRYRCRPTLGIERQPWALTRTFSFASPEYDASSWGTATEYGTLLDDTAFWDGLPTGFPAFDVERIGPSEGNDDAAPQGYWWTVKDFTLAAPALVRFFVASDNSADVYIDGFQLGRVASDGIDTRSFTEATAYSVFLSAGSHRVAAKVVNIPFGGGDPGYGEGAELTGNPTFFMLVGYTAENGGMLVDRVVETDSTWKLLAYPDTPPGLTDAEVIEILVAEAVADGVDPEFTVELHGSFDPVETITVDVGGSLLAHLKDRADGSWLDWSVPPTALELHLYPSGGRTSVSGIAYTVENENLERVTATQKDVSVTGFLVAFVGGWTFVGTQEKPDSLRTRAATIGAAKALAQKILDRDPLPEQVTADIAPLAGEVPGVDVLDGDTLTVGSFVGERCIGWSMTWSADWSGEPQFDIDLKDRIRGDEEAIALMVQRSAPGQFGGQAPASPAQDPPDFSTKIQQQELQWNVEKPDDTDYVVGEAPLDKIPSGFGNVYAVRISAKTLSAGTASVAYKVDGVDTLAGAGDLTSSTPNLTVVVPTDDIYWLTAGTTRTTIEITAVGTDLTGLTVEALAV